MIAWALIGFMVSLVLGLTGAGGGMVSLSLFLIFFDYPIQKATVLSLLAIGTGSISNWFLYHKMVVYRVSLTLALFSVPGSYCGVWLKQNLPLLIQKIILLVVLIMSVHSFWMKESKTQDSIERPHVSRIKIVLSGLCLGAFATLTGLGGGVILMPLFLGLGFDITTALASSYFTTAMTAVGSLIVQYQVWEAYRDLKIFVPLVIGVLFGIVNLKLLKRFLNPRHYSLLRRILFAAVVLVAAFSILPMK